MGGSDDPSNLVELTIEDHAIAHKVLYNIHGKLQDKIAWLTLTGRMKKEEAIVELMTKNNPMRRPEVVEKMSQTRKRLFAEGKLSNPGKTEKSRNSARKRMTENNPNQGGASNHTAYPVRVYFNDGTTRDFEYMKQITEVLNVSYASVKTARRKNIGIPKYNIDKIVKL
jgi:hypothetical protein